MYEEVNNYLCCNIIADHFSLLLYLIGCSMERGTVLSFCNCFILVFSTGVKYQYVIDVDGNDGKSEMYLIDLDRNTTKDVDKDGVDTDFKRFSEGQTAHFRPVSSFLIGFDFTILWNILSLLHLKFFLCVDSH